MKKDEDMKTVDGGMKDKKVPSEAEAERKKKELQEKKITKAEFLKFLEGN